MRLSLWTIMGPTAAYAARRPRRAVTLLVAGGCVLGASSSCAQTSPVPIEKITVTPTSKAPLTVSPGQTVVNVGSDAFKDTSDLTAAGLLLTAPGVTEITGSGPRDTSISIRGSNDRQVGGIKNILLFDDGFPITQPDGMSRADLVDPHVYVDVNVFEGPSSTLYGNYAVDGAIDFRTRPGSAINGAELGAEFGSFNSYEDWVDVGGKAGAVEGSVFGSNYRGSGFIANQRFDTSTVNAIGSYQVTPSDVITLKVINNYTDTRLPLRLSISQFGLNPYQKDCGGLQSAGCASVRLFLNGANGPTVNVSPQAAGISRNDRRTVSGLRWDHDFDADDAIRTQIVFDQRDIEQPTSSTSNIANIPALEGTSTLTHRGTLFGLPSTTLLGGNANGELIDSSFYNLTPVGVRSAVVQTIHGTQWNIGGRFEERLSLNSRLEAVLGLGGEVSGIDAADVNFAYPTKGGPTAHHVNALAIYHNIAPEGSLVYTPDNATVLRARVGTGYATPQFNQLFINSAGQFGNNATLQSQSNVGVDLGATLSPNKDLILSVTGFYEFFSNELVTQSPGANLQNFTFNAPASQHRGVEVGLAWSPLPHLAPALGVTLDQLFDDQVYTSYVERLSAGTVSVPFNRAGHRIPGVVPNNVDARMIYQVPSGRLAGLGGFLEFNWRDSYRLDNANLVGAAAATLVNLDLHYDPPAGFGAISRVRFFLEILNLFNRVTVGSAADLSDSINSAGIENGAQSLRQSTGSIFAGAPLSVYGGVRSRF